MQLSSISLALTRWGGVGGGGIPTDPNWSSVTLLLPGNGTNGAQNNTFLDASTNNFTITRNGNTTQGTFAPYGPNWSNFFDGSNDRLTIADNAVLRPGTANFTIEAWIFRAATGAAHTIYAKGGASTGFVFQVASTNVLRFTDTTSNIDSTGTIAANVWTHVAAVREGTGSNQFKLYINGVNDGIGTVSTDFNQTEEARIGENRGATEDFSGYISNFRFTTAALYTATFTPSTTPLTTTSQGASAADVELLTCQSNRFIDNSSNAFAITRNGDVSVQAFSPFAPTAAWSASTNGGSGYFDGTGDYLAAPANAAFQFGTGDFTIEFWYYPTSFVDFNTPIDMGYVNSGSYVVQNGTSGQPYFFLGPSTTLFTSATAYTRNAWNHLVVVRSGTNTSMYLNGARVGNATSSANLNANFALGVGGSPTFASPYVVAGYLSNVRLVKGSAVYDPAQTTLTVPTAPLTAITNTSLLLNFTNAGIFDSASGNDLETVGNAQVSTTQAKWGTTSISCDGTGDWLVMPDSPPQQLGTGNFTIEGWLRLNATGVAYGVISKGTATTGWSVNVTSGNNLQFSYTATQLTGATSLSSGQWYHFAVVRNGTGTGNLRIYLDGVVDATSAGAVTDNFNQTNVQYVGADRVGGSSLNGYIDDLRITNGVARYTANFTPPAAAFPTS